MLKLQSPPLAALLTLALALSWPALARAEAEGRALTLDEALALAEERSEAFQLSREEVLQAQLLRDRAWAAVLPRLSARGSYTHSDREIAFNDRVLQRQDSVGATISAELDVVNAGAIGRIAEAHHGAAAAREASRWTTTTLAFEVSRAFYTALAAESALAAAERSLDTAQEHLAAMEARRGAGQVLATDEGRARLEVVAAQEEVTRARNALADGLDHLAFLVGLEPPIRLAPPPQEAPSRPEAASERPDLRAAQLEVRAARSAVTSAWLDYLPTITLSGEYSATQNTGFSGDPDSWQLGLTLTWTIYDGGLRRADQRTRRSQLRAAQLRLDRLDRSARYELRRARRALETAEATRRTTIERQRLAEETRGQVLRLYRAGLATSMELVEADDELRRAELSLVASDLEGALSRLALLQAAGLGPLGREISE